MKLKRVLVVYKKSSFVISQERKDKHIQSLIKKQDPAVRFMMQGHRVHTHTLEAVQKILKKRSIFFKLLYRAQYFHEEGWDLVLSVGGDGTFLEAAHRLKNVSLLGLNSNPAGSVGFYCGARLENLEDMLDQVESGELKPIKLSRLELIQHGEPLGRTILNDVLIANQNPAATSRIGLRWKDHKLNLKCSGLWVSTAAGSTGAMRSAGGKVLKLNSTKFQVLIREPYLLPEDSSYKPLMAFASQTQLQIKSQMRDGAIYIDGAHHKINFEMGDSVLLRSYAYPLRVLGYNTPRRKKMET